METLYVVIGPFGAGGAYTDHEVAKKVKKLTSHDAEISEVKVNHIWAGHIELAKAMGLPF